MIEHNAWTALVYAQQERIDQIAWDISAAAKNICELRQRDLLAETLANGYARIENMRAVFMEIERLSKMPLVVQNDIVYHKEEASSNA